MESLEPHLFNRILFETLSIHFDNLYSTQIIAFRLVSHQWNDFVNNEILLRNLTHEMNNIDVTILFYDSILLRDWMLVNTLTHEYKKNINWGLGAEEYPQLSRIESMNKEVTQIMSSFRKLRGQTNLFCVLSIHYMKMPYSLFIKCVNIISCRGITTRDAIFNGVNYDWLLDIHKCPPLHEDEMIYKDICYLSCNLWSTIPIDFDRLSIKKLCSINIRDEYRKDTIIYLKTEYDSLKEIENDGIIELLDDKYLDNSGKIDEKIYELILSTLAKWE